MNQSALRVVRVGTMPLAVLSGVLLSVVQGHGAGELRLAAIARSPSHFVAVGSNGAILRSEDGQAWSNHSAVTDAHFRGVTFGEGRFVAVGDRGTLVTGTDSAGWQRLEPLGSNTLRHVTFGRGQFIAVGDGGTIQSSMDGLHWRPLALRRRPTSEASPSGRADSLPLEQEGLLSPLAGGTNPGRVRTPERKVACGALLTAMASSWLSLQIDPF